ncbi:MAG: 50S ribosomal protein L17 [Bacteroidales bacterium]
MRHQRVVNHLGRTSAHRKSMIANLATSLIMHKRITTTTAKARALRTFVEPLITKSKDDSTHSRRTVFSYLQDKEAVAELFREVSPKVADRPGGYTRILKTGNRLGDNAEMCIIELVDFNTTMAAGEATKAKATRRRKPAAKKKTADQAETKAVEAKSDNTAEETVNEAEKSE